MPKTRASGKAPTPAAARPGWALFVLAGEWWAHSSLPPPLVFCPAGPPSGACAWPAGPLPATTAVAAGPLPPGPPPENQVLACEDGLHRSSDRS